MIKFTGILVNQRIWYIFFGVLIFYLSIFLSIRASDEYRWSNWGFADAQAMLSLRQWEEEGWLANKFLFIPQGYAKVVRLFDEPALRHHAHGTCPISSPSIGPRLWYTHYPVGFLIPYALLFKLGLDKIFFMRLLSIIFSIIALILMYLLFSKIASPRVSFLSVVFYGLSSAFLGYADSLVNQPIDDLFRFAFMFAIVISTRASSLKQRKVCMVSAWIIEFLLSLSSFDSVFFVYLWLIGWDLLERRGFRWKVYLIFAMAPLTAHFLQFLQNVWYLGLNDAILDIKDAFLVKGGPRIDRSRLIIIWNSLIILFNNLYKPAFLIVLLLVTYTFYTRFLKNRDDRELPSIGLLALLFLCGLAFVSILPYAAIMLYEARQMAPFVALLVSGVSWSFLKKIKRNISPKKIILPYLIFSSIFLFSFWYFFIFSDRRPIFNARGHPDILLAQKLKSMPTKYETVIFDIGGFQEFWNPTYVPGYPQIHPITEYYADRPILCFSEPQSLASDLLYMVRNSPYKFSPIVISRNLINIDRVLSALNKEEVLKQLPKPYTMLGRYILVLTDYLKQ